MSTARTTETLRLRVDTGHPFLFDHELDHVPGLFLVDAVVKATERLPAATALGQREAPYVHSLNLDFPRFGLLDEDVHLRSEAQDGEGRHLTVRVTQGSRVICAGRATRIPCIDAPPAIRSPAAPPGTLPRAPAALVHRRHVENIAVGPLYERDGVHRCRYLTLATSALGVEQHRRTHALQELIEAGREFVTMMSHVIAGVGFEDTLVLQGVDATVARPLDRSEEIDLHSRGPRLLGRRMFSDVDLLSAGARVGSLRFRSLVLPPDLYRVLRGPDRS
ncbi:AfsA-related hotdog domain-containing protein [Streptomyces sp. NPDC059104]|uniref:AfsA-related hotdog domain-containing protein n=1 Tax=Streptomyces sp. NPDC059104 TaxID=3346729 RepID=UPI0036AA70ED